MARLVIKGSQGPDLQQGLVETAGRVSSYCPLEPRKNGESGVWILTVPVCKRTLSIAMYSCALLPNGISVEVIELRDPASWLAVYVMRL